MLKKPSIIKSKRISPLVLKITKKIIINKNYLKAIITLK